MRSRFEPMKKIARSLRDHRQRILNYFRAQNLPSSGVIESLNSSAMAQSSTTARRCARSMYPTHMEDANGNLVIVNCLAGAGMGSAANNSARIGTIEDVRGKGSATYTFTYNTDAIPHLTSITNSISTPEAWTFTTSAYSLRSPFTQYEDFRQTTVLASMTNTPLGTVRTFSYSGGTQGGGELLEATMPDGGNRQWSYASYNYSNGRTHREVQNRFLVMSAGATALIYSFSHYIPSATTIPGIRTRRRTPIPLFRTRAVRGRNGSSIRRTRRGPRRWAMGVVSPFQNQYLNGSAGARHVNYTWTASSSGNPYVSQVDTILDDGTSYAAHMRQTQVVHQYGKCDLGFGLRLQQPDDGDPDLDEYLSACAELELRWGIFEGPAGEFPTTGQRPRRLRAGRRRSGIRRAGRHTRFA